jgi:hypothetical protein
VNEIRVSSWIARFRSNFLFRGVGDVRATDAAPRLDVLAVRGDALRDLRLETLRRRRAIWCVDYRRTNELLPRALRKILDKDEANIFTTEMLNRVATTLEELDALSSDEFVLFFEPPSLDERIVNQFALFSLPSKRYFTTPNG